MSLHIYFIIKYVLISVSVIFVPALSRKVEQYGNVCAMHSGARAHSYAIAMHNCERLFSGDEVYNMEIVHVIRMNWIVFTVIVKSKFSKKKIITHFERKRKKLYFALQVTFLLDKFSHTSRIFILTVRWTKYRFSSELQSFVCIFKQK